jgi:hypothetical protein
MFREIMAIRTSQMMTSRSLICLLENQNGSKLQKSNLQNINIKTRILFTKFSKHHPKSAMERFNLPRENGGRGLFFKSRNTATQSNCFT